MNAIAKGVTKVSFGEYIKSMREAKGLTRTQLAAETSNAITEPCIWAIESGRTKNPRKETIHALLEALEVDLEEYRSNSVKKKSIVKPISKVEQRELTSEINETTSNSSEISPEQRKLINDLAEIMVRESLKDDAGERAKQIEVRAGIAYKKLVKYNEAKKEAERTLIINKKGNTLKVKIGILMDHYNIDKKSVDHAFRRKNLDGLKNIKGSFVIRLLGTTWIAEKNGNVILIKDKVEKIAI